MQFKAVGDVPPALNGADDIETGKALKMVGRCFDAEMDGAGE